MVDIVCRKINFNNFLLFDGAMGTMLQKYGIKMGELPESYNILHPEIIEKIHGEYLDAGSDVITTNTFGANSYKLKDTQYTVEGIVGSAVRIARKAAGDNLVALDIGPIGQLMEPLGTLSFNNAYEAFAEQIKIGSREGADIILIETMSDIYEAKAAILAAKENSSLPIVCTMSYQGDERTLTGTDPITMVNVLQGLGVDAIGVNCSLGPNEMLPIITKILKYSSIPVIVQPNAGLPKLVNGDAVFDVQAHEFAQYAKIMAEMGVTIFGGCCGTACEHITAIKAELKKLKPVRRDVKRITAVSSPSLTVVLGGQIKIIGERINPTGKKKLKEALKNNNMDYILYEAINQRDAGADILDVNVGLPEIDEHEVMIRTIKELQSVINLPLQIDSVRCDVIESAVRIYNGKPLINSVNGKDEVMASIFPIVKKYGACVIGLTIDKDGIPKTAEGRLKIAQKIVQKAEAYGIDKSDIIIDCLVLTASAQQSEIKETIRAVELVKSKLGVKTTLGVSNVSFGLPQRELLNRTFLAAALTAGLDAPILNPLSPDMMATINAFNVLWNKDKASKKYIDAYSSFEGKPVGKEVVNAKDLNQTIIDGLKEESSKITKELLKTMSELEVVNKYLIPSLDIVGQKYESGEIFLPQLLQSAEAVKKSFEVIKERMMASTDKKLSKGTIVLATVKGDIHDIGKNIVKILLENYGFEVIDLGKDVHEDIVVNAVRSGNIKLVGLSALMTTTVRSMGETIKALRDNNLDCTVLVGGAVLNEEYAKMIGADYYAKDATQTVKFARKLFKCE
ncbi:homocysteine S-methyltransferase family protein [Clostridium sp. CM028]|uniref:homocysteine S-methyltransferase family protein n=1 Tax=unclassified Clostridium TaxID=2614128 RepID=UPI001C0AEEE7|nr:MULTISPECIES: homocysteine S-methyltransferase family protein [unclassified Clostridium]MBU3092030.1 homocysteine S-methyltransferase family protein [Clostridium sp. CF011]MBW9149035.1 homocysteine S-methyltransferase family protein [Clostridium sp. CM028]WAG71600.1 homocysteine S-methyltransferase family protein [Clostridium sp. CF011]WLC63348.1 homocysteine S-methyltransferase family protein [Clostridium sp. CM028]